MAVLSLHVFTSVMSVSTVQQCLLQQSCVEGNFSKSWALRQYLQQQHPAYLPSVDTDMSAWQAAWQRLPTLALVQQCDKLQQLVSHLPPICRNAIQPAKIASTNSLPSTSVCSTGSCITSAAALDLAAA